jgi:phage terminase small subunit
MQVNGSREIVTTDQQELFCENFVVNGGNGSQAARDAGYSKHPGSSRVTAHRLLQLPRIRSRIHQLTSERLAVDAAVARRVLYDLALNAKSEQVRLYAAKDILSRAGVRPAESAVHYSDVDQLSEVELRDKILTLLDDLKIVDG